MAMQFKDWLDEFIRHGFNSKDLTNWPEEGSEPEVVEELPDDPEFGKIYALSSGSEYIYYTVSEDGEWINLTEGGASGPIEVDVLPFDGIINTVYHLVYEEQPQISSGDLGGLGKGLGGLPVPGEPVTVDQYWVCVAEQIPSTESSGVSSLPIPAKYVRIDNIIEYATNTSDNMKAIDLRGATKFEGVAITSGAFSFNIWDEVSGGYIRYNDTYYSSGIVDFLNKTDAEKSYNDDPEFYGTAAFVREYSEDPQSSDVGYSWTASSGQIFIPQTTQISSKQFTYYDSVALGDDVLSTLIYKDLESDQIYYYVDNDQIQANFYWLYYSSDMPCWDRGSEIEDVCTMLSDMYFGDEGYMSSGAILYPYNDAYHTANAGEYEGEGDAFFAFIAPSATYDSSGKQYNADNLDYRMYHLNPDKKYEITTSSNQYYLTEAQGIQNESDAAAALNEIYGPGTSAVLQSVIPLDSSYGDYDTLSYDEHGYWLRPSSYYCAYTPYAIENMSNDEICDLLTTNACGDESGVPDVTDGSFRLFIPYYDGNYYNMRYDDEGFTVDQGKIIVVHNAHTDVVNMGPNTPYYVDNNNTVQSITLPVSGGSTTITINGVSYTITKN